MAASWFYTERNEQKGPVSFDDLRGRAQAGYLRPTDLVWQEGTADWVRASLVDGLFELPTARPLDAEPERSPRAEEPRRYDDRPRPDGYGPAPRRPDYRDGPRDGPRSRPQQRSEGMSTGLKVGLIVGGSVFVLIVIAVILIVALSGSSRTETFTVELFPGDSRSRNVNVKSGQSVDVDVQTTPRGGFADVDIDVYDPRGMLVAQDTGPDMDCHVAFRATMGGLYRIDVRNLGPAGASARVSVRFR